MFRSVLILLLISNSFNMQLLQMTLHNKICSLIELTSYSKHDEELRLNFFPQNIMNVGYIFDIKQNLRGGKILRQMISCLLCSLRHSMSISCTFRIIMDFKEWKWTFTWSKMNYWTFNTALERPHFAYVSDQSRSSTHFCNLILKINQSFN